MLCVLAFCILHFAFSMFAIAAMTRRGRVIGRAGRTPWHLPEEMRWFREATAGAAVLMGRKTFEAIGRPLPGRLNLVATRGPLTEGPDVRTVPDLAAFRPEVYAPRPVWVIGGEEIFAQTLGRCAAVYLSLVDLEVDDGDAFFPAFEDDFPHAETIRRGGGFEVVRFLRQEADAFRLNIPR